MIDDPACSGCRSRACLCEEMPDAPDECACGEVLTLDDLDGECAECRALREREERTAYELDCYDEREDAA